MTTLQGIRLVVGQEFRMRLRTGRWRWLLGSYVVVLFVFTALLDLSLGESMVDDRRGVPMFGILMLFVLGLVLVISPALTAQSINGDRERGTLATLQVTQLRPVDIALGKLFASWAVGLVALALTLPFVGWAALYGGLTATRIGGVLLVTALLMGVICAVSQALSALLARSITSALLSYLTVFALTVGTPIALALSMPLTTETVQRGSGSDTWVSERQRPDRVWWLIAPNPFVVLADAAPKLPPRYVERGDVYYEEAADPLSGLGSSVRGLRVPPDVDRPDNWRDDWPVWPYGLGFDLLLAAGAAVVTVRRLHAPVRRLPKGIRIA